MVSTKCVLVAVVPFLENTRILRSWFLSGQKSHGWFFRSSWRFFPYCPKIYFKHARTLLSLTIAAHALWTELARRTPWRVGMGQNDTSESSALTHQGPFPASPKAGQLTYCTAVHTYVWSPVAVSCEQLWLQRNGKALPHHAEATGHQNHSMNFLTKDVQTLPLETVTLEGQSGAPGFAMLIGACVVNSCFILFSLNLFPHPDPASSGWVNFNGMQHFQLILNI